jgi:aerobic-type carbon monoxide dehydrogenase small subunit (CoxS/CutS family)/MFS family permease
MTYFVRPPGAVIFGSPADRIGRKRVMAIVLLMMSAATMLVGFLPGYVAIGIAAPVLLVALRALRSLSSGGEFGSISSCLLEHSPPCRRGLTTSWVMSTSVLGFLLGLVIISVLRAVLSPAEMSEWGWHVSFLFADSLGVIGLYVRSALDESPEFAELRSRGRVVKTPLGEVLKYWRGLLQPTGIAVLTASAFYLMIAFMLTYLGTTAGFGAGTALTPTLAGGAVAMVATPLLGLLSRFIGRKWLLAGASAGLLVLAVPLFALIGSSAAGAVLGQAVFGLLVGSLISAALAVMTEVFPTPVRATASSVSYLIGTAVFGGTAPLIASLAYPRRHVDRPGTILSKRAQMTNDMPPSSELTLRINGHHRTLVVDNRTTLVDVLRERLGLTGTKKGCDRGQCGACTVLADGERVNSCLVLAVAAEGTELITIEGVADLAPDESLHPVQQAFLDHDGLQCGYCTPGQICSAIGVLGEIARDWPSQVTETARVVPDTAEIRERMSGNLCRCGAYGGIVEAVRQAAGSGGLA